MLLPAIVLVLVAVALVVRGLGGSRRPAGVERVYVALAPLPFALAIAIPLGLGLAFGFGRAPRRVIHALNWGAIGLSLVLGVLGLGLVARAVRRGQRWGWPLGVMVVLAGAPLTLVALTYVMFWLAARL